MAPPSALVPTVTLVRTEILQVSGAVTGRILADIVVVSVFGRRREEEKETATRGAIVVVLESLLV
jgi:hypothetical protein